MPFQVCVLWQSWLDGGKRKTQTPCSVLFTSEGRELQVAILENTTEILGTQEINKQLIQAVFLGEYGKSSLSREIKSSILLSPQSTVLSTAPALPRLTFDIFIAGHIHFWALFAAQSLCKNCLSHCFP